MTAVPPTTAARTGWVVIAADGRLAVTPVAVMP